MGLLDGKVAVITGSGRGLGKAEALLFASEGARIVINDLGGGSDGAGSASVPADEVVAEIKKMGGQAVANYDSVATWKGGENIIKTAVDTFGKIDILVNNAGILRDRMVFNMTEDEWDIIQKVHLYGHFFCTRHACAFFRQQRSGRIINTSSQAGLGNLGQANYSAAKEGIVGFTRTVALDMAKYGVTTNCIRPIAATRLTLTPELQAAMEKKAKEGGGGLGLDIGAELKKMAPEHIAPLVVYLATDAAGGINGKTFFVGGGEVGIYSEPAVVTSIFKDGVWTVKELADLMPKSLTKGMLPPPPPPAK
ncbi:MAG: SDR family NAD(P)-dependent oxidoreductase [Dehalococcoidia bacterium]|nr:SDR family NAD(P)-dependent oxidoreductase [Dehalococcoidia bacterium]